MRVLHVSHQYPPAVGGSERYIADISEELVRRGYEVDVFTTRAVDYHTWRNVLPGFEQRTGVNVYRFRSVQRREYVWRALRYGLENYLRTRARRYEPFIFLGGGPLSPGMFMAMLHSGRQYDLIHLNCLVYAHVAYGYWAAHWLNIPTVITPHLHVEQEPTYNIPYQRHVMAGADHVFADTPMEQSFLVSLGLPAEQVSLGGIGLHVEQYPSDDTAAARQQLGLPSHDPIALFLGRKDKYKGIEIAVQAFVHLQARCPNLHLLAVGPETSESQTMWTRYQDVPNLHNPGAVSDKEKLQVLQACDFLILPSVGEAFGIVFLEAWIMGKPVIGARTQAVSTVIDEYRDGLLATPEDPSDLARCMAYLIEHPERRITMGQRGRRKVLNNYTVSRITDRVEAVYQSCVVGRSGVSTGERRVMPINPVSEFQEPPLRAAPLKGAPAEAKDLASKESRSMTDVIEIRDPELDQSEVRRHIQSQVAQRLAAGGYGPDPNAIGPAALHFPASSPSLGSLLDRSTLDRDLLEMSAASVIPEPQFKSNVPVIGAAIVALRRAWNWMSAKWYVLPILHQLNHFNHKSMEVVDALTQWQEVNDLRIQRLETRMAELEGRLARYEHPDL
jgi:glycosyltransferase involved in cell wall biosynthesis